MDDKGEAPLVVEAPGVRKPLVILPRGPRMSPTGELNEPVVEMDLEFAKGVAGCCLCDIPIPKGTTRLWVKVRLLNPVPMADGRMRRHEKYYLHPGCITDRVKPEVIRTRVDCFDCGAIPEQQSGGGYIYHTHRCFTVSRFAAAPLCAGCTKKPRWKQCHACQVFFPHWMIQEAVVGDVPLKHQDQYAHLADLVLRQNENVCEFCAKRLGVSTVETVEKDRESWEQLRAEIREHGILEAGEHD